MVLEAAYNAWQRLAPVRERRRRYARYTYGDQWSDLTTSRRGEIMTEHDKALTEGRMPLTNNLIRRLVKAVIGRWRTDNEPDRATKQPDDDNSLEHWIEFNSLYETDARTLEEFLISGMAVHRVGREKRQAGEGVWVDNVSPDRFFISAVTDSRCRDMELVGRITDMSLGEVIMRFARGDRKRAMMLRRLYGAIAGAGRRNVALAPETDESFFHAPEGRCRVIEVWTLECRETLRCHDPLTAVYTVSGIDRQDAIDAENSRRRAEGVPLIDSRWEMTSVWHCRIMAPDGTLLDEYDADTAEGGPPFAVKLYPMVDGDVHSLVEDVIDQQRYVNRLISLMDKMMNSAAKGVLLYPQRCKIDGQSWEEIGELWSDPEGVIPYHDHGTCEPHQVVTPAADIGAREMLTTQIKMFEEVSGISDALLGKAGTGVVGVERYESQVRNASIAVCDILRTFGDFVARRNRLISRA